MNIDWTRRIFPWFGITVFVAGGLGCGGAQSGGSDEATGAPISMAPLEESEAVEYEATPVDGVPPADAESDDGDSRQTEEDREGEEEPSLIITAQAATKVPPAGAGGRPDDKARRAVPTPPTPQAARPRPASKSVRTATKAGVVRRPSKAARSRPRTKSAGASRGGDLDGLLDGAMGSGGGTVRGRRSAAPSPAPSPRPAATPSSSYSSSPSGAPALPPSKVTSGAALDAHPTSTSRRTGAEMQGNQSLRVLTAATVPDSDRFREYLGYQSRHRGEATTLGLDLSRRVRFRIVDGQGRPVHDATLTLIGSGFRVEGRTHADGNWDFFPTISAPQASGQTALYIQSGNSTSQATVPIPVQGGARDLVIRLPQVTASLPQTLDLAFVIDVTGSMGDELRYVNEEVVGIVNRVRTAVPNVQVRVAATFYRDRSDSVPIAQIPFSTNIQTFVAHMRLVEAGGGGDYPEDMNVGLAAAMTTLQWSQTPAVRALVLVADAPPQHFGDFPYTYHHAMADASARGIRILPVAASGADRVVEYLFRAMGAFTSTPYVYLTDDSGIGSAHMEADTDRIAVEMFSDLLTRVLINDLQGRGMHEPDWVNQQIMVPQQ